MSELHSSIIALVSLASGVASNHPAMGQCQLAKLRSMGITEDQIATVVEIARHIRDEAAQKTDAAFDEKSEINVLAQQTNTTAEFSVTSIEVEAESSCCSSAPGGQSCC